MVALESWIVVLDVKRVRLLFLQISELRRKIDDATAGVHMRVSRTRQCEITNFVKSIATVGQRKGRPRPGSIAKCLDAGHG